MALSAPHHRRNFLPSRPVPSKLQPNSNNAKHPMDVQDLIGMTRVGGASVAPDGSLATFGVRNYDFDKKKWVDEVYLMDMAKAEAASEVDGKGAWEWWSRGRRLITVWISEGRRMDF